MIGNAMPYTLQQAADAAGKAKSTIWKACESGKISYTKDEHGQFLIEPAELHRVYPPKPRETPENVRNETDRTEGNGNGNSDIALELAVLREKLAGLQESQERERAILSAQLEDLRRDRDDMRGERDKLLRVLEEQAGTVRLLTGPKAEPMPAQPPARRWLGLFRR
jgi:hypothetical protein